MTMKKIILSLFFLLALATSAGAVDYTQDANCLQAFILDDGTANTNDRSSGGRNLTLANGTWDTGNNGYIFDADATGSFTPALTTWQGEKITIAILAHPSQVSGERLFRIYQASDGNRQIDFVNTTYSPYDRPTLFLGRQYTYNAWSGNCNTSDHAKQWFFITYDYTISPFSARAKIYRNTTDDTSIAWTDAEYGTMTIDTGVLGNGSTHTIYQVGVFNRILSGAEMSDIVTNGLKAAAAGGVLPVISHHYNLLRR